MKNTDIFISQEEKIMKLRGENQRFDRVFSEYTFMSEQLWLLESEEGISVPDDFLTAITLQTGYLEEEICDWLHFNPHEKEDAG